MDSPHKKLGSAKDGSKTPHHLLPMSVTVAVSVAKKKTPDDVRRVMAWALFNAFIFVVSYAMGYAIDYALHHYHVPCSQFSFLLRCDQLTDAEEAEERTHWIVILSCAAFQVAAAALVRWLPGRRRWVLRALAYLTLALTVVGQCTFFADVCLNHAGDPGHLVCCGHRFLRGGRQSTSSASWPSSGEVRTEKQGKQYVADSSS